MDNDFILVLDLGGPQAVAMARKLRNQGYYTEIASREGDIELFRRKAPRGMLIAGGDDSPSAEAFPRAALSLGIPVLAMGSAARMMAEAEGAAPEGVLLENSASQITFLPCELFDQLSESDRYFVRIDGFALPEGFRPIATTIDGLTPAFADFDRNLYALQFYAESNDPDGAVILANFAERVCGCTARWSMENYIEEEIRYIQDRIGDGQALMAISGGVDSSTCAMLMHRAIGDRLKCVFVDNGLLRTGEAELVLNTFRDDLGLNVIHIDARDRFLARLKSIVDPTEKQVAVRGEFINILIEVSDSCPEAKFMVKGTIYSDLLSTGKADDAYARRFCAGQLIEPIRMLFKDEVRRLGEALGLPQALINRQPFPGAGLAVRCAGEVTEARLNLLRRADAIFREEIQEAGQDKRLSRYFAVLTDTRTLGWRDGVESCECACALRAVAEQGAGFSVARLPNDLLERVAQRVTAEVPGINRVVYDITDGAHSAVEWG